ncbi:hypothetical protein B9Z55_000739 [Caenorhabditis nigoni]|uniref:CCHC-type domain-containing protein n=1 Tax=Caenorhabditis nigoni TaxID=1611254 RepID=A0A2G5VV78_9PELO|nr:hypothetical protein B9Z55_000739 [Caenorhabditis nigoni]
MDNFFLGLDEQMNAFVQAKEPKTPEEYLEEACKCEMFGNSRLQSQHPSSSMQLPPELLTTLNRASVDTVQDTVQTKVRVNQSQGQSQVFANQAMSQDIPNGGPNFYQYNQRQEQQQPRQNGGFNQANQTFSGEERNSGRKGGYRRKIRCFYCKNLRHYANECYVKRADIRNHKIREKANKTVSSVDPVAKHRQAPPTSQVSTAEDVFELIKRHLDERDEQNRALLRRNLLLTKETFLSVCLCVCVCLSRTLT